jgi:hypothetical protein
LFCYLEIERKRHEKRKDSTKESENRALDAQKTTYLNKRIRKSKSKYLTEDEKAPKCD